VNALVLPSQRFDQRVRQISHDQGKPSMDHIYTNCG
jgi:hypothetical protein